MSTIKIWVISDTHCRHHELKIPEADMVIHCGDSTNIQNAEKNLYEGYDFLEWFNAVNFDKKILIAGNHDAYLLSRHNVDSNYLEDALCKYKGIRFYGTPYTPKFGNWYFMLREGLEEQWSKSIQPCDVLITHGPPKFILDSAPRGDLYEHCGSIHLYHRINKIKPKLCVFGHIHNSTNNKYPRNNGVYFDGYTWFINASCCSDGPNVPLTSHGWIVEINNETKEIVRIYKNL
jgi:Icc-related predicted phosphoesterase